MYQSQVPRVESQRASEVTDHPSMDEAKGDLLVNNLIYKQPKALSLAKSRTQVKQFFQRSDYPSASGKTAIIDWNTGSSYIDVGNSYLSFVVDARNTGGNGGWSYGSGSAMNVINRITIRSRSGTELERLEGANLWSRIDSDFSLPRSFRETMGSAMGMDGTISSTNEQPLPPDRMSYLTSSTDLTSVAQNPMRAIIPLKQLCPFFRPLKGQLMPPQLASGLHIEIVFENTTTVFKQQVTETDLITTYDVSDINFLLDTVDLSDETQKSLNMESADNGLEWVTPRIYTATTALPVGQAQTTVQVRKSCSQATMAHSTVQETEFLNDTKKDSFQSQNLLTGFQWQYRIGSLHFPQQPIVEDGSYLSGHAKSYFEALYAFDKPKHPYHEGSVSIRDFIESKTLFAMSASKNDDLFLSGLPINNSRVLEFNYDAGSQASNSNSDRRLTTFLEYIQVVKCYIDNTSVAI